MQFGKTKIIILGAYEYANLPSLKESTIPQFDNSVAEIRKHLTSVGLDLDHDVCDLFNKNLSIENMCIQIKQFAQNNVEDDDNLIVIFVGHGILDPNNYYHLCVRNSDETLLSATALSHRHFVDALELKDRPGNTFFIIDACFASELEVGLRSQEVAGVALLAAVRNMEARVILEEDVLLKDAKEKHTVFSQALLDVLRTEDQAFPLTLRNLYEKVKNKIEQRYRQAGKKDTDADVSRLPYICSDPEELKEVPFFPLRESPSSSPSPPPDLQLPPPPVFRLWFGDIVSPRRKLEDIVSAWSASPNNGANLCLVTHFAADAAVVTSWVKKQLDSAPLPVGLDRGGLALMNRRLNDCVQTNILLDFSLLSREDEAPAELPEYIDKAIERARLGANRLALVFPRSWLSAERIRRFVEGAAYSQSFVVAELFARDEPEATTVEPSAVHSEIQNWLTYFRSANSPALAAAVQRFLAQASLPAKINFEESRRWLLDLARQLVRENFLEPAFRLELFCLMEMAPGGERCNADVLSMFVFKEAIRALVDVETTPELRPRAVITQLKNAGLVSPFVSIEQYWSPPRIWRRGWPFPCWLPVRLTPEPPSEDLTCCLRNYFEQHPNLPAHARLAHSGADKLNWMFGSPMLLLVEDMPPSDSPFTRSLITFLRSFPQVGCYASWPEDRYPAEKWFREDLFRESCEVRLRPLALLPEVNEPETVAASYFDRPLGKALVSRFLCRVINPSLNEGLKIPSTRYDILEDYVQKRVSRVEEQEAREILDVLLPKLASTRQKDGTTNGDLAVLNRLQGELVRVADNHYHFAHPLIVDFFAARFLALQIAKGNAETTLSELSARINRVQDWEDVFSFLICQLDSGPRDDVVRWLARQAPPRLVCLCLQDLSRAAVQSSTTIAESLQAVARGLGLDYEWSHWDDAHALGFHDPRLFPQDPLGNLLETDTPGFRLGKYPVTNLEYSAFVADRGYQTERWWKKNWDWLSKEACIRHPRYWYHHGLAHPNAPVVGVSFFEAEAYCRWLTERWKSAGKPTVKFRLPLREERDTVAKIVQKKWEEIPADSLEEPLNQVIVGLSLKLLKNALHRKDARQTEGRPVGLFPPNDWGCHDLFGLIWEWCAAPLPRGANAGRPENLAWVKGSPLRDESTLFWGIMGGMFDPRTRFHQIGFRLGCDVS